MCYVHSTDTLHLRCARSIVRVHPDQVTRVGRNFYMSAHSFAPEAEWIWLTGPS